MRGKSTLGFATRTEAVRALRDGGLTTAAIATRLGISQSAVTGLEHSAGRYKEPPMLAAQGRQAKSVMFSAEVWRALRPEAACRACRVEALVREIVERVVTDGLIKAVLDDETPAQSAGRAQHA